MAPPAVLGVVTHLAVGLVDPGRRRPVLKSMPAGPAPTEVDVADVVNEAGPGQLGPGDPALTGPMSRSARERTADKVVLTAEGDNAANRMNDPGRPDRQANRQGLPAGPPTPVGVVGGDAQASGPAQVEHPPIGASSIDPVTQVSEPGHFAGAHNNSGGGAEISNPAQLDGNVDLRGAAKNSETGRAGDDAGAVNEAAVGRPDRPDHWHGEPAGSAASGEGTDDDSDPVAELIAAGVGRRRLAAELGVTEHQARQLLAERRNGGAHVSS